MPKMKTNKSVKSRFKVTGTGKLLRNHPERGHLLSKKTSKRKRHLKKQAVVSEAHSKKYSRMMGV